MSKDTREKTRVKQLVLQELTEIAALWWDTPLSQHLVTILRPYSAAYEWNDELLLKKVEKYRDELETDQDE